MGWREFAAHHFVAEKHAVGSEHVGQAVIRQFGQTAGCCISLDLAAVGASDLYRNIRKRCHLGQTGLGRSTIAGEHIAKIDVILAEAMPIVAATAAMKARHRNAESEGAIAQQRQAEAVAAEGHEQWARARAIHRKGLAQAGSDPALGLLPDPSPAEPGPRPDDAR